jgi:DNA-binding response OmpR family regulator
VKNRIYIFGDNPLLKIVTEILFDYKISLLTLDQLNNENFKNNNIILFGNRDLEKKIKKHFFAQNNAIFFIRENNGQVQQSKPQNTNFFYGQLRVKKFVDEIKTCFISKKTVLKKIEIFGDKITNTLQGLSVLLTPLEKEILTFLFEYKRIKKDYLLEKIIKIKKEIETKTAESHITRIRKKLMQIKSEIQIKTKEDFFYLDY